MNNSFVSLIILMFSVVLNLVQVEANDTLIQELSEWDRKIESETTNPEKKQLLKLQKAQWATDNIETLRQNHPELLETMRTWCLEQEGQALRKLALYFHPDFPRLLKYTKIDRGRTKQREATKIILDLMSSIERTSYDLSVPTGASLNQVIKTFEDRLHAQWRNTVFEGVLTDEDGNEKKERLLLWKNQWTQTKERFEAVLNTRLNPPPPGQLSPENVLALFNMMQSPLPPVAPVTPPLAPQVVEAPRVTHFPFLDTLVPQTPQGEERNRPIATFYPPVEGLYLGAQTFSRWTLEGLKEDPEHLASPRRAGMGTKIRITQNLSPKKQNILLTPSGGTWDNKSFRGEVEFFPGSQVRGFSTNQVTTHSPYGAAIYDVYTSSLNAGNAETQLYLEEMNEVQRRQKSFQVGDLKPSDLPPILLQRAQFIFDQKEMAVEQKLQELSVAVSEFFSLDPEDHIREELLQEAKEKKTSWVKLLFQKMKDKPNKKFALDTRGHGEVFLTMVRLFGKDHPQILNNQLVRGYRPTKGEIFEADEHFWPEVFLAGSGWVVFEPSLDPNPELTSAQEKAQERRNRLQARGQVYPIHVKGAMDTVAGRVAQEKAQEDLEFLQSLINFFGADNLLDIAEFLGPETLMSLAKLFEGSTSQEDLAMYMKLAQSLKIDIPELMKRAQKFDTPENRKKLQDLQKSPESQQRLKDLALGATPTPMSTPNSSPSEIPKDLESGGGEYVPNPSPELNEVKRRYTPFFEKFKKMTWRELRLSPRLQEEVKYWLNFELDGIAVTRESTWELLLAMPLGAPLSSDRAWQEDLFWPLSFSTELPSELKIGEIKRKFKFDLSNVYQHILDYSDKLGLSPEQISDVLSKIYRNYFEHFNRSDRGNDLLEPLGSFLFYAGQEFPSGFDLQNWKEGGENVLKAYRQQGSSVEIFTRKAGKKAGFRFLQGYLQFIRQTPLSETQQIKNYANGLGVVFGEKSNQDWPVEYQMAIVDYLILVNEKEMLKRDQVSMLKIDSLDLKFYSHLASILESYGPENLELLLGKVARSNKKDFYLLALMSRGIKWSKLERYFTHSEMLQIEDAILDILNTFVNDQATAQSEHIWDAWVKEMIGRSEYLPESRRFWENATPILIRALNEADLEFGQTIYSDDEAKMRLEGSKLLGLMLTKAKGDFPFIAMHSTFTNAYTLNSPRRSTYSFDERSSYQETFFVLSENKAPFDYHVLEGAFYQIASEKDLQVSAFSKVSTEDPYSIKEHMFSTMDSNQYYFPILRTHLVKEDRAIHSTIGDQRENQIPTHLSLSLYKIWQKYDERFLAQKLFESTNTSKFILSSLAFIRVDQILAQKEALPEEMRNKINKLAVELVRYIQRNGLKDRDRWIFESFLTIYSDYLPSLVNETGVLIESEKDTLLRYLKDPILRLIYGANDPIETSDELEDDLENSAKGNFVRRFFLARALKSNMDKKDTLTPEEHIRSTLYEMSLKGTFNEDTERGLYGVPYIHALNQLHSHSNSARTRGPKNLGQVYANYLRLQVDSFADLSKRSLYREVMTKVLSFSPQSILEYCQNLDPWFMKMVNEGLNDDISIRNIFIDTISNCTSLVAQAQTQDLDGLALEKLSQSSLSLLKELTAEHYLSQPFLYDPIRNFAVATYSKLPPQISSSDNDPRREYFREYLRYVESKSGNEKSFTAKLLMQIVSTIPLPVTRQARDIRMLLTAAEVLERTYDATDPSWYKVLTQMTSTLMNAYKSIVDTYQEEDRWQMLEQIGTFLDLHGRIPRPYHFSEYTQEERGEILLSTKRWLQDYLSQLVFAPLGQALPESFRSLSESLAWIDPNTEALRLACPENKRRKDSEVGEMRDNYVRPTDPHLLRTVNLELNSILNNENSSERVVFSNALKAEIQKGFARRPSTKVRIVALLEFLRSIKIAEENLPLVSLLDELLK